jgi:hypothetical protein
MNQFETTRRLGKLRNRRLTRVISMFSWLWAVAAGRRDDVMFESRYSIDPISGDIYAMTEIIGAMTY